MTRSNTTTINTAMRPMRTAPSAAPATRSKAPTSGPTNSPTAMRNSALMPAPAATNTMTNISHALSGDIDRPNAVAVTYGVIATASGAATK